MKIYILFFAILTFCAFQSYSQSQKHFSYLVVTMRTGYDEVADKSYYAIVPEGGDSINSLVSYSSKQRAKAAAPFYKSLADTASTYFNYFSSVSKAFQYLDEKGWQIADNNRYFSTL